MSAVEFWRCAVCGVEARGTPADLNAHLKTVRHHWNTIDYLRGEIERHRETITALERDIDHHTQAALQVVADLKASSLEVKS